MIVIVPSRRGVWAGADSTPYGQGLPYSKAQLRDLLHCAEFSPIFWGEALYAPPVARPFMIRSAPALERIGAALGLPFAGVHIVEAIKQTYRPVRVRAVARSRLVPLNPALAPSAQRQCCPKGPFFARPVSDWRCQSRMLYRRSSNLQLGDPRHAHR